MKTYMFRIGENIYNIVAASFSAARNELKRRLGV